MLEHEFTECINNILKESFSEEYENIYLRSPLLQYLNYKTKAANADSKSRPSFANLYAIYALIKDYINNGFLEKKDYSSYLGARFTDLHNEVKKMPFGDKLQNHAFNSRLNDEFDTQFVDVPYQPIIRDKKTKRYWINENLLKVKVLDKTYNIAKEILSIIDLYIETRKATFNSFIEYSEKLKQISNKNPEQVISFILEQIKPSSDARTFEIVSYAILKYYYIDDIMYWNINSKEDLKEENLLLFKTGRTNANDGGIDFVMKPIGKFFQVTETLDFKKYFLDIDKVQKFPITFVVKTKMEQSTILEQIRLNAEKSYGIKTIVERYMSSVEEIINISKLESILEELIKKDKLIDILEEIILQSRIEFNYEDEEK